MGHTNPIGISADKTLCHHTCKDLLLKGKDFPGVGGVIYIYHKKGKSWSPKI